MSWLSRGSMPRPGIKPRCVTVPQFGDRRGSDQGQERRDWVTWWGCLVATSKLFTYTHFTPENRFIKGWVFGENLFLLTFPSHKHQGGVRRNALVRRWLGTVWHFTEERVSSCPPFSLVLITFWKGGLSEQLAVWSCCRDFCFSSGDLVLQTWGGQNALDGGVTFLCGDYTPEQVVQPHGFVFFRGHSDFATG